MLKSNLNSAREQRAIFIPDFCSVQALLPLIIVTQLFVFAYQALVNNLLQLNWASLALTTLYVQWFVLLNAAALCQLQKPLARLPAQQAVLLSWLLIIVLTFFFASLVQYLRPQLGLGYFDPLWVLRDVLLAAVFAGIALRYRYLQSLLKARQQAQYKADIMALQARIKPHFLFNSLNSISSLMHSDVDKADQALDDLAQLFRASLQDEQLLVSWHDEIALCKKYLAMESLRLGPRLELDWQIDIDLELQVPLLTLQPILENAVIHGIARRLEGGCIRIKLEQDQGLLRLEVSNPVDSNTSEQSESSGNAYALGNIEHRLAYLYGEQVTLSYGLDQTDPANTLFKLRLSYPQEVPDEFD